MVHEEDLHGPLAIRPDALEPNVPRDEGLTEGVRPHPQHRAPENADLPHGRPVVPVGSCAVFGSGEDRLDVLRVCLEGRVLRRHDAENFFEDLVGEDFGFSAARRSTGDLSEIAIRAVR